MSLLVTCSKKAPLRSDCPWVKDRVLPTPRKTCSVWPPPSSPAASDARSPSISAATLVPRECPAFSVVFFFLPPQGLCTSCTLCLEHPFQPLFYPFTYVTPAYPSSPSPIALSQGSPPWCTPRLGSQRAPHPHISTLLTIAECTVVYMILLLFEDQGPSPWNPGSSTMSGFQTFSKDSLDFFL